MLLTHLQVADFRSYERADLELPAGVSVLLGRNGQGKTNLVEAVHYLATLGSHRVATDAPLIRTGAASAVVRGAVLAQDRRTTIEVQIIPGRVNRAQVNRSPVRPRAVLGLLRTVVFAPEDLALVKGDPGERRRFLDDLLVARRPRYAGVRADWERALKQRNALLRTAVGQRRVDEALLDVFDGHVARTGAALLAGRLALIAALRGPVERAYAEVSGSAEPADLRYLGTVEVPSGVLDIPSEVAAERLGGDLSGLAARMEELLLDRLAARRRDELDRGITLVGPHRDELELRLGVRPVRGYASHGESWSFALALRLASFDLLRNDPTAPGDPVLILDDVFAELDVGRRSRLAALVADAEQVLVTAAVADDVPSALRGARFQVTLGQVEPVTTAVSDSLVDADEPAASPDRAAIESDLSPAPNGGGAVAGDAAPATTPDLGTAAERVARAGIDAGATPTPATAGLETASTVATAGPGVDVTPEVSGVD